MVRVVLTYGSTSPRLRADLSSLTGRLVSVRVVHGPICLVPINMSLFKVWMILAADDSSRDFSFASVTSAHFSCCFGFSCFVRLSTLQLEQPVTNIPFGSPNSLHAVHATPLSSTYFKFNQGLPFSHSGKYFLAHLSLSYPLQYSIWYFQTSFFSSPGPKVHVNYCHHLASVVCRL